MDFLSQLGTAQAQDAGNPPPAAGNSDFLSQLSDAQATDSAPQPSKSSMGQAIGYGLVNAIPFGKDIGSAVGAAESYLPSNLQVSGDVPTNIDNSDTFGQRFSKTKSMVNAQDEANQREYPVTSFVVPLATSVAALPLAGPIDAISSGIAGVAPRLGGLAADSIASGAVGAGYGSLYGAGTGDSLDDRISNAESGALFGGVGGAAAPAIANGVGSVAKAMAIPFRSPEALATNRIAEAVAQDQRLGSAKLSPSDFSDAQAAGQPVITGDIGGQSTRRLARAAANASPEADAALAGPINERYEDQGPRVADFLKNIYGNNLDAGSARAALDARAAQVNTPAYRQAYADGANGVWNPGATVTDKSGNLVPALDDLIKAPDMQSAIQDATRKGANSSVLNGNQVVKNPFVTDNAGNLTLATDAKGNQAVPTLQFWDQVKRGLDDKINVAKRAGNNEDVRDFVGLKSALVANLDQEVPSYATARQGAYQAFGAENALQAGENFLKLAGTAKTADAKTALAAMSPAQQKLFSQGLASQMAQAALNAPARRNVIAMFNSPETAERLQMGLGPTVAPQVEAFLRRESAMDMLRTAVGGNSTTAQQGSDLEKAGHGVMGMVKGAVTSPIAGAVAGAGAAYHEHGFDPKEIGEYAAAGALTGLLGKHFKGANSRIMTSVGEQLASSDPSKVNAALKQLAANPRMMESLRATEKGLSYLSASQAPTLLAPPPKTPAFAQ